MTNYCPKIDDDFQNLKFLENKRVIVPIKLFLILSLISELKNETDQGVKFLNYSAMSYRVIYFNIKLASHFTDYNGSHVCQTEYLSRICKEYYHDITKCKNYRTL